MENDKDVIDKLEKIQDECCEIKSELESLKDIFNDIFKSLMKKDDLNSHLDSLKGGLNSVLGSLEKYSEENIELKTNLEKLINEISDNEGNTFDVADAEALLLSIRDLVLKIDGKLKLDESK